MGTPRSSSFWDDDPWFVPDLNYVSSHSPVVISGCCWLTGEGTVGCTGWGRGAGWGRGDAGGGVQAGWRGAGWGRGDAGGGAQAGGGVRLGPVVQAVGRPQFPHEAEHGSTHCGRSSQTWAAFLKWSLGVAGGWEVVAERRGGDRPRVPGAQQEGGRSSWRWGRKSGSGEPAVGGRG